MNEQIIIETLIEQIKKGEINLEDLPIEWKDKVSQYLIGQGNETS